MRDVLVVVDVINTFAHDDGGALLGSFRSRLGGIESALTDSRASATPVVFVNDGLGRWDGDAPGFVRWAMETGHGPDVVSKLAPAAQESFLFKARYSAFDHTALDLLLAELECERILLCGAATEGATTDEELERVALAYAEQVGGIRVARARAD